MTNRKMFILLGLPVLLIAAAARLVLVTPDNPQTNLSGRHSSDALARIIIGPYPAESDFRLLKLNNVGLVVSQLDSVIRYEAPLPERETAETQFLAALRQVPDNADALGGLGLTYHRAGRRDDAIRRRSEALAITPGNRELRDARARAEASK